MRAHTDLTADRDDGSRNRFFLHLNGTVFLSPPALVRAGHRMGDACTWMRLKLNAGPVCDLEGQV